MLWYYNNRISSFDDQIRPATGFIWDYGTDGDIGVVVITLQSEPQTDILVVDHCNTLDSNCTNLRAWRLSTGELQDEGLR
jgi:hypothetical protein